MNVKLLILLLLVPAVYSADYYVRAGVTGDGSGWDNAWGDFNQVAWNSVSPGDTVWIAGGTYTMSLSPTKSGTATDKITIRRATSAEHGTDSGWQESYDAQIVLVQGANIQTGESNLVIDGITKSGLTINLPVRVCNQEGIYLLDSSDSVTVRNVLVDGMNDDWGNYGAYIKGTNNIISHCEFRNVPNDGMKLRGSGHIIEYTKIGPRSNGVPNTCCSDNACHGDGIEIMGTSDIIFRYNHMDYSGAGLHFGIGGLYSDNWDIYGNIFTGYSDNKLRKNSASSYPGNIKAYNNVFYNLYGAISIPVDAKNNIYYLVENNKPGDASNVEATSDPFIDAKNFDFHLNPTASQMIDKGTDLGMQYNHDADSNIRGSDGAWDIGAYEYSQEPLGCTNCHYVRAGSNGDGSDWANAWGELNQITGLGDGDRLEIAQGTYYTSMSISGNNLQIVATSNPSYAGLIKFTQPVNIDGAGILFDGQNQLKISLENSGWIDSHYMILHGSDIHIANMELDGPGYKNCHGARAIQPYDVDSLTIDNLYIHDFSSAGIRLVGGNNITVQNSRIQNIKSAGDVVCQELKGTNAHFEHIAVFGGVSNFELKNCIMSQIYDGTLGGGWAMSFAQMSGGYVKIHDNVFFNLGTPIYVNSDGLGPVTEFSVNGNTFVGYRLAMSGNPTAHNNIFCNLDTYFADSSTRWAYYGGSHNLYCDDDRYRSNYQSAENSQVLGPGEHPFVDYLSDWHLAGPTNDGMTLTSNTDIQGVVRGADGLWDRGAYEYTGACTPMTIAELSTVIGQWKDGAKTIEQVMQAIKRWKDGC